MYMVVLNSVPLDSTTGACRINWTAFPGVDTFQISGGGVSATAWEERKKRRETSRGWVLQPGLPSSSSSSSPFQT